MAYKKIYISMPDSFLKQVDELARKEQRTRSELIREALRRYISEPRGVSIWERVAMTAPEVDDGQVERDVAEAIAEVRAEKRKRRTQETARAG